MHFWEAEDAIGYLNDIRQLFENGDADQLLVAKLQSYAERAQKARASRHMQPLAVAA